MKYLVANYLRFKHVIWFSLGLIIVGISMLIWWQCTQTVPKVNNHADIEVTANQTESLASQSATSAVITQKQKIIIDVKGGVFRPGVYYFNEAPIVADVISKAGGFKPEVNRNRINLAAPVATGTVLYIPLADESIPLEYPLPGQQTSATTVQAETMPSNSAGLINLNTADLSILQTLPGIGAKRAQDIIDYREKMGGFKTLTDLKSVAGIGEKTYEKLVDLICV